jgi:hypothetical protein
MLMPWMTSSFASVAVDDNHEAQDMTRQRRTPAITRMREGRGNDRGIKVNVHLLGGNAKGEAI